jgi:uncharacterized damage-inducible protein DinB
MSFTKDDLIKKNNEMVQFIESLKQLPVEQWRSQVAEGKWSIAEIIAHLSAWDTYMIKSRLSIRNGEFEATPDVEEFNLIAAEHGRNELQETIINEFFTSRKKINKLLEGFDIERLHKPYYKNYSILEYLSGSIEHDMHHQQQIEDILKKDIE